MLGFIIGAISGLVQYWLLSKFTGNVTRGKASGKTVLFAITQFLLPFVVLVGVAFLLPDDLMFAAIGMASALIVGAVIKFFFASKAKK